MSLNITDASARQCLKPTLLTLLDTRSSGDSSFTWIYEYSGDSKLSLVCKGFQEVGDRAMANLTQRLLNNGLCLELRLLKTIRPLRIDSFASPREYTNKVKQVLESGLSKHERLAVISSFWKKMFLERGGKKYLVSNGAAGVPHDYFDYDHIDRLMLQTERLKLKQDQQDESLMKLASELEKQIPAIPDTDVGTVRAWLSEPANQAAIQAVIRIDLSRLQLKVIPPEVTALVNLRVLNLDGNQISEIPAAISQLVNLQMLYLVSNQITQIPAEIGNLVNLGELGFFRF